MSGRAPIKIFEYNRDGKHIRTFQNMSLCRSFHFSDIDGKIPILRFKRVGIEYGLTKDENYLVKERLGKQRIKYLRRLHESEYCTDLITRRHRIIQVFNLEGVLLLEARNATILNKLVCIPQGTISQQLSRGLQIVPRGEFIFKYKEEEVEL